MKRMKKFIQKWKECIKVLLFLSIFVVVFGNITEALKSKNTKFDSTATSMADGCDVIFMGTSQAAADFNPQIIWEQCGIPSYNFGAAGQYIKTTDYFLQDILQHQKPKVLVLDIECMTRWEDFLRLGNRLYNIPLIDDLKLNMQNYDFLMDDGWGYFIPLFRYHNRWKELTREDFQKGYTCMGATLATGYYTDNEDRPPVFTEFEDSTVRQIELDYLAEVVKRAQGAGIEVILVDMPSYDDKQLASNAQAVRLWAQERDITFLSFNTAEMHETIQLSIRDFSDAFHLNIKGANRLSVYIGNWLLMNGYAVDRRSEEAYAYWDEKIAKSAAKANNKMLKMTENISEHVDLLTDTSYTIIVSLNGEYDGNEAAVLALAELGINRETFEAGGTWVFRENNCLFYSEGKTDYRWHMELGRNDLVITCAKCEPGESVYTNLTYNFFYLGTMVKDGINFIVYDPETDLIVDAVGFDATDSWRAIR